jgi:hypothetical protein
MSSPPLRQRRRPVRGRHRRLRLHGGGGRGGGGLHRGRGRGGRPRATAPPRSPSPTGARRRRASGRGASVTSPGRRSSGSTGRGRRGSTSSTSTTGGSRWAGSPSGRLHRLGPGPALARATDRARARSAGTPRTDLPIWSTRRLDEPPLPSRPVSTRRTARRCGSSWRTIRPAASGSSRSTRSTVSAARSRSQCAGSGPDPDVGVPALVAGPGVGQLAELDHRAVRRREGRLGVHRLGQLLRRRGARRGRHLDPGAVVEHDVVVEQVGGQQRRPVVHPRPRLGGPRRVPVVVEAREALAVRHPPCSGGLNPRGSGETHGDPGR